MQYELSYKSQRTTRFTSLIKIDEIKLCEILNGTATHAVFKWLFKYAGKSLTRNFHRYPYVVSSESEINKKFSLKSYPVLGGSEISKRFIFGFQS